MARENAAIVATSTRVVLLDALGTMVWLRAPWELLGPRLGLAPDDDRLVRAFTREIAYYREHAHEGRDRASLAELRGRCAAILSDELGREIDVGLMMSAISFEPYEDTLRALEALRAAGLATICVSNWDCSLPSVLDACGVGALLDSVVTSAGAGARKPDPAIFELALEAAGCSADEAIHVGDTVEEDVAGARAAGIRALHIDRSGGGDIGSLDEVARLAAG